MKKRKELVPINESGITVEPLFTDAEIISRNDDYQELTDKSFDESYRDRAFQPILLTEGGKKTEIQYNFCTDTFCPNYKMPMKLIKARGERSMKNYKYSGAKFETRIACNVMGYIPVTKSVFNNESTLLSNWSIAEEIKRLKSLSMVRPIEYDYTFHHQGCSTTTTPFDDDSNAFASMV